MIGEVGNLLFMKNKEKTTISEEQDFPRNIRRNPRRCKNLC